MEENKNKSFVKKHPILMNAIYIAGCAIVLAYMSLLAIDVFTGHGKSKEVPDVRNLPLDEAAAKLEDAGFKWEISDSTYNEDYKPGVVIDQDPKAHSQVKDLRTIYLSVNAMTPRLVTLPALTEISVRQGQSILMGLGFKSIRVDSVPSPYKGLILNATAGGRKVTAGMKLPLSTQIILTVGDGSQEVGDMDSMGTSVQNVPPVDNSGENDFE